jgi:SPP1 family predicted phage head-tail adaptor
MEAGKLRRPIKIKQPIDTPDGMGGVSQVWTDVHECMAAIEPMTGKEVLYAGEVQEKVNTKITIRYQAGIKPAWRIYDGNTAYRIDSVIDIGTRQRELQITAERLESEAQTATIDTPTITSPVDGAIGVSKTATITAAAFVVTGGTDTHYATQWQIATAENSDFGTVMLDDLTTINKTSLAIPAGLLSYNTEYTVRVKFTGTAVGTSDWSAPVNFTTISSPTIITIDPDSGPTTGGTAVIITGTQFNTALAVTFGGVTATSIIRVSATEITCITPAGTAGAQDVVITNTDTGTVTAAGGFEYEAIP